jgi:hypothetical protein
MKIKKKQIVSFFMIFSLTMVSLIFGIAWILYYFFFFISEGLCEQKSLSSGGKHHKRLRICELIYVPSFSNRYVLDISFPNSFSKPL